MINKIIYPKILIVVLFCVLYISCASEQSKGTKSKFDSEENANNKLSSSSNNSNNNNNNNNKNDNKKSNTISNEYDYLKDNYEVNYSSNNNISEKNIDSANILQHETLNKHNKNVLNELYNNAKDDPFIKVFSYCYLKKFKEAKDEASQLYMEYKKYPTYWNFVGTCFLLEGNISKARLYYNKALEIDQNYTPSLNNLGVLYLKEKRDQKALTAFIKATKSSSFAITPIFNLANLYMKYGLIEKALPLLESLYSNEESSKLIYFPEMALNYAYALILKNDDFRAKDVFNKIDFNRIKENPKLEKTYYEIRNYISN